MEEGLYSYKKMNFRILKRLVINTKDTKDCTKDTKD